MDYKQSRVVSALAEAYRRDQDVPHEDRVSPIKRFYYREKLGAVSALFGLSIEFCGTNEGGVEEYLVQHVTVPAHAMFDVLEEFNPEWVTAPVRAAAVQILLSDPAPALADTEQAFDRALACSLKLIARGDQPHNWVWETALSVLLNAARYEQCGEFHDVKYNLLEARIDRA